MPSRFATSEYADRFMEYPDESQKSQIQNAIPRFNRVSIAGLVGVERLRTIVVSKDEITPLILAA